ncbi:MAG: bacteriocin family protein [Solirubrobacterales bacterium]|nr:bacteriocin family protein [Solirubrobacterales bacterium]
MSNHLLRSHAPISDGNWKLLDEEARERLAAALGARKLIDFLGPFGWQYSSTNLGRVEAVSTAPCPNVTGMRRRVLPLAEVRAEFAISRAELRDDDRGAQDADLEPLDLAAHRMAVAENKAVFHGWPEVDMVGISEASPHQGLTLGNDPDGWPRPVASAVLALLQAGVDGPYGLALGSEEYKLVAETAEHGGYPLRDHLHKILGGEIVWAPGVSGGVVLSLRGDDFLFESGQDLSIGYLEHDRDEVRFYLEQSFSFHVATPEAAVPLAS